jgi:hypothetical protein
VRGDFLRLGAGVGNRIAAKQERDHRHYVLPGFVRCERHVSLDRDASFHSGTLVRDLRKRGYGEL